MQICKSANVYIFEYTFTLFTFTSKTLFFSAIILTEKISVIPFERLTGGLKIESLTNDSRIKITSNSGSIKSAYKVLIFNLKDSGSRRPTGSMSTLTCSKSDENNTAEYLPECEKQ